jgi:hypothetical protein
MGKLFKILWQTLMWDGAKGVLFSSLLPFVYQEVRRLTLAAHVAAWLPGVSCRGLFASITARREKGLIGLKNLRPEEERGHPCPGRTGQWTAQDASPDRFGPRLI